MERLKEAEELAYGTAEGVHLDLDEMEFVVRNVWGGCSCFALHQGYLCLHAG